MKLEKSFQIAADPEKVMNIMRDPKLIEEDELARKTQKVIIKDLKNTKDVHSFEITTVTFVRGMSGVDTSKTQTNTNIMTWDLKKMESTWDYKDGGDFGPKIHINGGSKLAKKGTGTELTMKVNIDIDIPLLGGTIAKKVAQGFERGWPEYVERINKWLKK